MELTNQKVINKKYGEGKVVSCLNGQIVIRFVGGEKKFLYPEAFVVYLRAVDPNIQKEIEKLINSSKLKPPKPPKPEHKAKIFYVFQGKTFERECRGGYIWAPKTNKAGSSIHHWNRLRDVCAGDIILHGCGGKVVAISRAKGPCYDCLQPEELRTEKMWDKEGRRVDCEYYWARIPITTADYKDIIIKFSKEPYSPFNELGRGNMGYLYDINRELAHLFIAEIIKANKDLAEKTVIVDLLKTIDFVVKK